ncbi:hypothetical protein [Oscillatoria acuminata]|uniref:Uncharacterized protein n=1 Tax=Oscillatoria acuminata PCC 6304 TaxID=56110 RepID=K9TM30_9CYAN|nr:hypothetical protein [Oscillatoria acuminata]AFY83074.1 hypothetical protein Oscil6304_3508 [Oscillatoria acuminata PCC 6304]
MNSSFTRSELRKVAKYYRLVSWAILASLGVNLLLLLSASSPSTQLIVLILLIVVGIFQFYVLYNLGKSLNLPGALIILIVLSAFVPLLALALLAYMHDRAMKLFKSAGVKVGFMGANPASIKDE